ncbi:MAG TPA: amino acid ABC transporter permease [Firmicutes bacterium]|nr:amino acid ABC transporter permease [Bacillota bacterium]HHY98897.1 amino acid ABC transporter permease [Bacillota bacterium]
MDFAVFIKYLPVLAEGAIMTVELTVLAIIVGTALGLFIALAEISHSRVVSSAARFYTWLVRGTPLLLQLFTIYYGLPQIGLTLSPFVAAVTGMSLNSAAYVAEIIRGAIESIDKGQMEAARSLGMSYLQAMRRIILPQAYRRLIPPMGNEFIALLKDSSLVATISMVDLMRTAQQMYATTFRPVEIFAGAGCLYLLLTTFFTITFGRLEKRLSVYQ